MKVVLEIPKEFENHFKQDKFSESFLRISGDIKHKEICLAGNYERELIDMLETAFQNCEVLKGN